MIVKSIVDSEEYFYSFEKDKDWATWLAYA